MTFTLRSVHQPDWEIPLETAQYSIGRSDDNQIVLPDASISRHHATLQVEGDTIVVVDEGSSNGTFVNGTRIQEVELKPGDVLKVGRFEFTLVGASDAVTVPAAMQSTQIDQPGEEIPSPDYLMPVHATPPPPPPPPLAPKPKRKGQKTATLALGIGALILFVAAAAVIITLLLIGRNRGGKLSEEEQVQFITDSIVESDYPDYMGIEPSITEWEVQNGDGYVVTYSFEADEPAGFEFPRALNFYVNPDTNEVLIEEMN